MLDKWNFSYCGLCGSDLESAIAEQTGVCDSCAESGSDEK